MHLFHRWSKWEEYTIDVALYLNAKWSIGNHEPVKSMERWQKRTCIICGYTQRKEVDRY